MFIEGRHNVSVHCETLTHITVQLTHGWFPTHNMRTNSVDTWIKVMPVKFYLIWKTKDTHIKCTNYIEFKWVLTRFACSLTAQQGQFDVIHCCRWCHVFAELLCVQVVGPSQSQLFTIYSAQWSGATLPLSLSLYTLFLLNTQTFLSSISPPTTYRELSCHKINSIKIPSTLKSYSDKRRTVLH